MLRFVVLFALVAMAFAEPEADPGMVLHPNGALVPEEPVANKVAKAQHLIGKFGAPVAYPYALPYAPYTYSHPVFNRYISRIFKREAEAEADPLTVYNHGVYNYGYTGWPYTAPVAKTVAPLTYTTAHSVLPYTSYAAGYPYVNPYTHVIAKRDAEADPLTVYNHGYNYAGYWPYTSTPLAKTVTPFTYAAQSVLPYTGYTGYSYPYVNSHIIAKRDAEADPLTVYSGINNYQYTVPSVYTGAVAQPAVYTAPAVHHAYNYAYPYAYSHYAY